MKAFDFGFDDAIVVGRVPVLPAAVARAVYAAADPFAEVRALLGATPAADAAIRLASPSLHASLADWRAGRPFKNKRAPLSALAYVLRMATRCTPFGLFAGIGEVALGDATSLELGPVAERRTRTRPDMEWTDALLRARLRDPAVFAGALAVTNDLAVERGDGLYLYLAERAQRVPAEPVPVWRYDTVYLRLNDAVRWVRAACAGGLPVHELAAAVGARLGAAPEQAWRLVARLVDAGVLVLQRPPLLGDPFGAVRERLRAHADEPALGALARDLAALDAAGPAALDAAAVAGLETALRALEGGAASPLQVDLAEPFAGTLGRAVLADAATLAKIGLAEALPTHLGPYVERFIERYETIDRLVPLLELVQDDFVLPLPVPAAGAAAERDRALAELAAGALRSGAHEVELGAELVERLYPGLHQRRLPHACEVGFTICAPDRAAIDRGDYTLVATKGANSNGVAKSASRFGDLLGPGFGARVAAAQAAQPAGDDLVAELDYAPLDVRYANLVVRSPLARHAVADAASALPEGVARISPADVLIGIENGRFVAYARSARKRLRLEERFLLEAAYFAPPHARFLSLLAQQDRATPRQWSWGAGCASLPFLPRVRYGRIVLSAARWLVPKADLAGDAAARTLAGWRTRWNLPRWVYLTERDVKLLLDLDAPAAVELLRGQVARSRDDAVVLEEMLPAWDDLWLQRDGMAYQHELVVTLTAPAAAPPAEPHDFGALDLEAVPLSLQSPWAYVKLYATANEMDTLVQEIVPALTGPLEAAGAVDRWFFLRYRDPEPHVRLRLRAARGNGASLVEPLTAALEPLLAGRAVRRYAFDVYVPDAERYGGPAALAPVEALFHAGSAGALAGLGRAGLDSAARNAAALASLPPLLGAWFARFAAEPWLDAHAAEARTTSGVDYGLVRELRGRLAAAGASLPPDALAAIDALAALHAAGALARPPAAILSALIHMHFNRFGVLFEDEPLLVTHLWRALFRGRGAPAPA